MNIRKTVASIIVYHINYLFISYLFNGPQSCVLQHENDEEDDDADDASPKLQFIHFFMEKMLWIEATKARS